MLVLLSPVQRLKTLSTAAAKAVFDILHNGFALLGVVVVAAALLLVSRPELLSQSQTLVVKWLTDNPLISPLGQTLTTPTLEASERATAADPGDLPKQQADVAHWLSKKYRVAPEPISALVTEAYRLSASLKIEPTLLLAIMAIESGFNPFAQSHMGAQGLMQVLTKVHTDKYDDFGGNFAAFDPLTNLKVGAKVLKECIAKAGSIEGGLKFYVGAGNLPDDGGYVDKVLAEQSRLKMVAAGKRVDPQATPALNTPVAGSQSPKRGENAFPSTEQAQAQTQLTQSAKLLALNL